MVTLNSFVVLGAVIFCIGLFGALSRRNAVGILMSIEIMLNAVNITLVAFASAFIHDPNRGKPPHRPGLRHLYHYRGRRRGLGRAGDDYRHLSAKEHD